MKKTNLFVDDNIMMENSGKFFSVRAFYAFATFDRGKHV